VTLQVKYGEFNDPGTLGRRIADSATTKINQKHFGLSINAILDDRLVAGEEIQIAIGGSWSSRGRLRKAAASSRPPSPAGRRDIAARQGTPR
jgi:hypothetical protein